MEQVVIVLYATLECKNLFESLGDNEKTAKRYYMLRRCKGLNPQQAEQETLADFT